ncbi:MAG: T9SS type A sorting domain-containing protein [Bacteroidales bacterium]|nr:T9SS type A sorting domain-containing protein [Bacteroidales bacterium]
MKNRLLPFGLLVLFLGFSCCLISAATYAATPDKNTPDQPSDVRMQKIRSNQVTGIVNPADVLSARYQLSLLQQKSATSLGLNWMHVGPTNYSGRSRVVLFDNQDSEGLTIYTGGVTGGVYKSANKGLTWHALNTGSTEILRVASMAQTPAGTLYVGTGEYYYGGGAFMGTGLYRSVDGMNFTLVPGTQPILNDPLSNWAFIIKLACDPNSGRLFAATSAGIKYSDDGDTWTSLMTGMAIDVTVGTDGTVLFVVDNHVYIAPGGNLGNITDLSTGDEGMLPVNDAGWTNLAIAPSDPGVMYASIAKLSDEFLLGVFRSEDGGATWSLIFPPNPTYEPFFGNGSYSNVIEVFPNDPDKVLLGGANGWFGRKYQPTGYFDWQVVSFAFLFNDPNVIPATPPFHHDYAFRPGNSAEFAIATSNGISIGKYLGAEFEYQTSNKNLTTAQFNSVAMTRLDTWVMGGGVGVGTELFNAVPQNAPTDGYIPPTTFWNGTFGQWSQLKPDYIFFSGTGFFAGGVEPYVRSEDLGETAALSFLGAITSSLTDYLPTALWETTEFPYSQDTVWLYARQGTIEADSTVLMESMNCYECTFEYTVPTTIVEGDSLPVIDPYHSRFFIYGTSTGRSGVYMTQDAIKFYKVPNWIQVAETSGDVLTSMALSSDLNYLWAGTETGKLYRISNLTLALDSVTGSVLSNYCIVSTDVFEYPEMAGRYITNVAIDPNNDDNVMVTLGNYGNQHYVYVAENGLDSLPAFVSAQGNLPGMPVFDGLFEMHGEGRAVIGTDMGVFTTANVFAGSPDWAQDLNGMGDLPVTDLQQQTWEHYSVQNTGYIAAATYGKGLYYDTTYYIPVGIDPGQSPGDQAGIQLQIHPNPAKNLIYITYTLSESSPVVATVYDLTGRLVSTSSFGTQLSGTHTSVLNINALPGGTYIVRVNQAYGKVVKTN